eukprot:COSAG02_NODE_12_length_58022_cov_242.077379_48_plen_140_part_00
MHAHHEIACNQVSTVCYLCREKLKHEKQQLVDTVEALSKRVRHLEQRSATGALQPAAQLHVGAVSPALSFASDCSAGTTSPVTTPSESPEVPALVTNAPRRNQLDGTLSHPLRDVSKLFGLSHFIQRESSITTIDLLIA